MRILVIGGTRNLGFHLVQALYARGDEVTTFNRGATKDELPREIRRLHGDRSREGALAAAIADRSFDAVVDMISMRGTDTVDAIGALLGKTGHYVHISTGQVYLVRQACPAPARETDYDGPLTEAPDAAWEHREWTYGIDKRASEDALSDAAADRGFASMCLRFPMLHGPRDHYGRIHGLVLRYLDGGPVVTAAEPAPPLRHLHVDDAVAAILATLDRGPHGNEAFNIVQPDSLDLDSFFARLADQLGARPQVVRWPRARLVERGVFPACSPFSNPWMSLLDGARAERALGVTPQTFDDYLPALVDHFRNPGLPPPTSYAQRDLELALAD